MVEDEKVVEPPPQNKELENKTLDNFEQAGDPESKLTPPPPAAEQGLGPVKEPEDENKIFEKVEVEAEFPGGLSAWRRFLERNLNAQVPSDAGAPTGSYTVIVKFIVDKSGAVSDVRATTSHGFGMEEEAVRAIRKGPKWTPAIQNGRQVNAYRQQPITFVVADQ